MKKPTILTLMSIIALSGSLTAAAPVPAALEEPQAIEIIEPEVPVNYLRWGVTGEVVVTFQIDEQGRTENVSIESSDDRLYAKSVRKAVRQWRYRPATKNGVKVRVWIRIRINLTLN